MLHRIPILLLAVFVSLALCGGCGASEETRDDRQVDLQSWVDQHGAVECEVSSWGSEGPTGSELQWFLIEAAVNPGSDQSGIANVYYNAETTLTVAPALDSVRQQMQARDFDVLQEMLSNNPTLRVEVVKRKSRWWAAAVHIEKLGTWNPKPDADNPHE